MNNIKYQTSNIKRILICVICVFNLCNLCLSQNIEATAKLDSNKILIGDQVNLILSIKYPKDVPDFKLTWPILQDTIIKNIEILKKSKIDTVVSPQNPSVIEQRQFITLTCFDSGFYAIPPFIFTFTKKNDTNKYIILTEPLLLEVHTVPVDTADISRALIDSTYVHPIKDIKPPFSAPLTFREILPYILYALAGLVLIAITIYLIKYRKKAPIKIFAKPRRPPHFIALEKLNKLNEQKLWQQGKVKLYHSILTEIIRTYIEERFEIPAMEQTSYEILESFPPEAGQISEEAKEKLKEILVLADFVKFAKAQPLPNENDLCLKYAYFFVENTKPYSPPPATLQKKSRHHP